MHGLSARCASVRTLEEKFLSISEVGQEKEDVLVELANSVVSRDEADVVILGGAPLAGLADRVRDRVSVPLVDPIAAAVKQAETLVRLHPRKAITGTFRRPGAKTAIGLPESLSRRIGHVD